MILLPFIREDFIDCLPKAGVGCEIGVAKGAFSRFLNGYAKPSKLHLIDPWEFQDREDYLNDGNNVDNETNQQRYEHVSQLFSKEREMGIVEIHRGFSQDIIPHFSDKYFDWMYIDGMHTYEAVTLDLENSISKLKDDGVLFGHDYANHPKALNDNFGVVEAVNDFVVKNNLYFLALTNELYPTYIIVKNKNAPFVSRLKHILCSNLDKITEYRNYPNGYIFQQEIWQNIQHEILVNNCISIKEK